MSAQTPASRPYRMVARAERAQETGERIVDAALELYFELWLDEITLEQVAKRAGVATRTLQRRYGGRDGLLAAVSATLAGRVAEQRFDSAPGDVDGAVENLMEHYENVGRLALRNMAQALRSETVGMLVEYGRDEHRRWVDHVFAPILERRAHTGDLLRAQLLAITDVTVWDVLRNQVGLSRERTTAAIGGIVVALLAQDAAPGMTS